MASINKLAIRGVRAFSPDDEEQVIVFSFPLTIIVGANGCGKTTIIESLKYAVTGSFPPGVKNGQAFVHDPKSAGQSSVKASIKLRFTNRAGNSMVVIRSMEVTQKKTTLTFKALDGILRTTHPETGERISMSHKCTELDRQIPTMLGVSKAILEHVVFCHQEESSWPLQEGAVLKKRFDEIFDSTRYAKALKAIAECKKDYAAQAKEHQIDLAALSAHRQTASQFRLEMESTTEKLADVERTMQECEDQMKSEDEVMAKHRDVLAQVEDLREQRAMKVSNLDREQGILASRRKMLERDMTIDHTLEDLQKMARGFGRQQEEFTAKLKAKIEELESVRSRIAKLSQQKSKLLQDQSRLETLQRQHECNVDDRNSKIAEICNTHKIEFDGENYHASQDSSGSGSGTSLLLGLSQVGTQTTTGLVVRATQDTVAQFSEDEVDLFASNLQSTLTSRLQGLADMKQRHQTEQDQVLSELGDLQAQQSSIENDINRIKSERKKVEQEINTLRAAQQYSRVRKNDVDEAKENAERMARERDEIANDPRLNDIPLKIKEHEKKIETLKRSIEDETEVLGNLRKNAQEQTSIATLEKEIDLDVERLEDVLKDNSFILNKYNLKATTELSSLEALAEAASDKKAKLAEELRICSERVAGKQQKYTEQKTLWEHARRSIKDLQRRLQTLESDSRSGYNEVNKTIESIRVYEAQTSGSSTTPTSIDPKELAANLNRHLQDMNADGDDETAVVQTIRKLKKMSVVKDNSGGVVDVICPCCRRQLDSEAAAAFNQQMESLANPETSAIIQSDRTKSKEKKFIEAWYNSLNSGLNDWQEHARLKRELDKIHASVDITQREVSLLDQELNEEKKFESELKTELSELTSVETDAIRLRDDATRINDKLVQIKRQKDRLNLMAPNTGGRSLKQVEIDLSELVEQKDNIMGEIANFNKEMTKLNNQIAFLSSTAATAEKAAKEKEDRYNRSQESTIRREALTEQYKNLELEIAKLDEQKAPIRQKVLRKTAERDRLRSSHRSDEEEASAKVDSLRLDVTQFQGLIKMVREFLNGTNTKESERVAAAIQNLDQDMENEEMELATLIPEVDDLKTQNGQKERQQKILNDNIDYFTSMDRIKELEDEVAEVNDQLQSIRGVDTAEKGYKLASARREELKDQKVRAEGQRIGLKDQLKNLKRKLQSEDYKDVDERHRVKMIEHETTKLAVSDLDKYHSALDKALMKFHSIKIADINKIIRELWTLTYKGEDIYNIELVSGQDGASKAAKSYNYRVVMSKGNTQMDMRGRCSAGQRVLASIVIRLALAETFCLNCGVMALDEPTTNLDFENKRGLALALAQIISNRAQQHNFQLLIITHDEEFVHMMKEELAAHSGFTVPEQYFQVSREEGQDGKFYSRIHAVDWDSI